MIILGYQGIGKSTMSKDDFKVIDLESSCFTLEGQKINEWYKAYGNLAMHLSSQGYTVFTATHAPVRDWIARHNTVYPVGIKIDGMYEEQVMVVVPNLSLKDQWTDKLWKRFEASRLFKDYCAWSNAKQWYESNISEIVEDAKKYGWKIVVVPSMEYNLKELIEKAMK